VISGAATLATVIIVDILYVVAAFVGSAMALEALHVPRPGAFAVLVAVGVATWRLHRSGLRWADVGLRPPGSWGRTALWAFAAYVLVIAVNFAIITPLARAFGWPPTDVAKLGDLAGDLPRLLGWLAIAWTTAAFGEELLFRGFLQTRLTALFRGGALGTAAAIVLQAILFGLAHLGFGVRGAVTAGVVALVFGVVYVLNGRNLWPLIIAHGLTDTVSLVALYFGAGAYMK
jgi:membrane protease YdiL (CAAX protease family)